ncbi:acyl-CoA dehydratase activase-related protein [Neomoorella humiferrea]|uniref:2-hydroxyglutaryl-CoA dehydratase, D-component n=1 Tax=Neomoorella humiferrea TaxID=676965 RepID=A0A2T0AVK3_9FIRM|nr:acyl-CoA dehydratase activase-related protein [Moorella humiferrea]PRR74724.1 2-hydroxyglutaryl-CoA dehydratase, D-component [Moorella humiferrea]
MKVTFPHMGHLWVVLKTALEGIGLEVVVPPPCTRRTLELGVRHAPESACLPLKVNLGNFLEAKELGADTIVMAGGVGPCRIGYYAQVQREILRDIGCEYEMVVFEPPDVHFSEVLEKVKYLNRRPWQEGLRGVMLAWQKACALDYLEQRVQHLRPREAQPGRVDAVFQRALRELAAAASRREIKRIVRQAEREMATLPLHTGRTVLKIGIVGEIYTVLEPLVNLNIEKRLGTLGVEVVRGLFISRWINDNLFKGLLPLPSHDPAKTAPPFLNHFVGGHGWESVGDAVTFARHGCDGVIQLAPLTCMPEIVAHSVMPAVQEAGGVPVMTLYLDEQTGEAGLQTRLEAFVDMLYWKKKRDKERRSAGAWGYFLGVGRGS